MSLQYDDLSELYEQVKILPVALAERASLVAALPDLRGASVLDVGTGTGFFARLFRRLGAERVVGVDSAASMVARARAIEESEPLGIGYLVYHAADLPKLGEFQVVAAVWLLGYAESTQELDRMVANLADNLAPGGTMIALIPNPDIDWRRVDGLRRYGLSIQRTAALRGRQGSRVRFHTNPPFDIEGWTWPAKTINAAIARANLTGVRHHPLRIPTDRGVEYEDDFWDALAANPTFRVISCVRPTGHELHSNVQSAAESDRSLGGPRAPDRVRFGGTARWVTDG